MNKWRSVVLLWCFHATELKRQEQKGSHTQNFGVDFHWWRRTKVHDLKLRLTNTNVNSVKYCCRGCCSHFVSRGSFVFCLFFKTRCLRLFEVTPDELLVQQAVILSSEAISWLFCLLISGRVWQYLVGGQNTFLPCNGFSLKVWKASRVGHFDPLGLFWTWVPSNNLMQPQKHLLLESSWYRSPQTEFSPKTTNLCHVESHLFRSGGVQIFRRPSTTKLKSSASKIGGEGK